MAEHSLIYDWNIHDPVPQRSKPIEFDDETLRDGLQSPSVVDPPIEKKIEILHLMAELGIQAADVGLPGAGPRAVADVDRLVGEIIAAKLPIAPNCAARTVQQDIEPIIELSQKHGLAIEVAAFIGSSPVRQYTENWDLDFLLRTTEKAIDFCMKNDMPVMFVTEDTLRAQPEDLRALYSAAIQAGAGRICCSDTVGHATPHGTRAIVRFLRRVIEENNPDVKLDWHGHKDRALGVANTLAAIEEGVDRVHGTALGIGERCGNTPMDAILVNCRLLGWIEQDLTALQRYTDAVAEATGTVVSPNYPVVGLDAFRTATGVHAAAIIKAKKKGDDWLADLVYSSVPASWFGLEQRIEIGPMSGESNVIYWLEKNGYEATPERVSAIFARAKKSKSVLQEHELRDILKEFD